MVFNFPLIFLSRSSSTKKIGNSRRGKGGALAVRETQMNFKMDSTTEFQLYSACMRKTFFLFEQFEILISVQSLMVTRLCLSSHNMFNISERR